MRIAALLVVLLPAALFCGGEEAMVRFPDGAAFTCEIADTQQAHVIGLSRHEALAADRGMIFVYPRDSYLSFWMPPEMRFDIDIIFLDADARVICIADSVSACPDPTGWDCPSYGPKDTLGRYVVEVVAGTAGKHGLEVGDKLELEFPPGYQPPTF